VSRRISTVSPLGSTVRLTEAGSSAISRSDCVMWRVWESFDRCSLATRIIADYADLRGYLYRTRTSEHQCCAFAANPACANDFKTMGLFSDCDGIGSEGEPPIIDSGAIRADRGRSVEIRVDPEQLQTKPSDNRQTPISEYQKSANEAHQTIRPIPLNERPRQRLDLRQCIVHLRRAVYRR
jgi:hypothetical protein